MVSGAAPRHSAGEYRVRRRECERAAELLGVRQLRDLSPQDLWRLPALPEPLDRRARPRVTPDPPVPPPRAAPRGRDLPPLGQILPAPPPTPRQRFMGST